MFLDDKWESYFMDRGISELLNIIKLYYLDYYEIHLVKKIMIVNSSSPNVNAFDVNLVKFYLEEYYRFLASFDLEPYVYKKQNREIIENFNSDNPNYIGDYCMKIYNDIKQTIPKSDITKDKNTIIDIIKHNSVISSNNLNKKIMKTINSNDDFKHKLMISNKNN